MCDKLKFNNLVISNKKGIQQCRVQTINKLVHKMRKLKTLLEKHPDDIKCKERIRKSNETMEILKKIKRVEVMKNVLLMDKSPAAVITNGLATPEEVAIALLSMNKVMLCLIKRFKSELLLDECKREEWQKVFMESSKRRQKIDRTEEKRRKRLDMKQQKVLGRRRQEWLEQNCPQNISEYDGREAKNNDLSVSTTGTWQIEKLLNEAQEDKEKIKKEIFSSCENKRTLKEYTKMADMQNKKQKRSAEKNVDDESESGENSIEKLKLEFEVNRDLESVAEETGEPLVVDPFFITDTGENYLSTAVVKNYQDVNNGNDEEKHGLHMIKLNTVKSSKDFKHRQQSRDIKKFGNNKDQRHTEKTMMRYNKNNNLDNNKWHDKKSEKQTNGHNLHPSWVAKQKLKPLITSFQGKKIKFNEDDETSKNQNGALQQNKDTKPSSPSLKTCNSEKNSLHPSWAAKQKLKPTITAFQGKKITFNDDD